MQAYQTPGVYYERVDAAPAGIAAIRTDIAGFVGFARSGPLHTAVPVQSWRQFQSYFGDFTGAGYLAYAVRGFFENGGKKCWVVRVASEAANTAEVTLQGYTVPRVDLWSIVAFSPGVWGNELEITIRETHAAQTQTDPRYQEPEYSVVRSVSGFDRGTHVRLSQDGTAQPVWKVVSDVDPGLSRLIWVSENPAASLPYDAPITGFDSNHPIIIESVEYTLLVRELGRLIAVYERLSLVPENPRYGPLVLPQLIIAQDGCTSDEGLCVKVKGPARSLPSAPAPIVIRELRSKTFTDIRPLAIWDEMTSLPLPIVADHQISLAGGADGLALVTASDFVGEDISPFDSDEVKQQKCRGLKALEEIDEVAIVAVPDINIQPFAVPLKSPLPPCIPDPCLPSGPLLPAIPRMPSVGDLPPVFSESDIFQVQAALIQQCEKLGDRIGLLDTPLAAARADALGIGAVRSWRGLFDSKYAGFYYPWVRVVDPLGSVEAITRDIPPCGHVAGQYAQTDFQVGVHKAPANSALVWVQDVTVRIDDATHGVLNPIGINVIRPLPGRGIRILGARTVSSDSDWRFVNVRRLLMMIEKAIYIAIQWAVFEPNNQFTRAKLRLALTSFLLSLWQKGALMGATADEAFFVKCDEKNNPEAERANGKLLAQIGVAPSQPFEFVILRVGRKDNEFEISEVTRAYAGGSF